MEKNKEKTKECLQYIKSNYVLETLSIENVVTLTLQWCDKKSAEDEDQNINMGVDIPEDQQEERVNNTQKEEETHREDYKEMFDDDGRLWYSQTHFFKQRPESRKLSCGDIIKFRNKNRTHEGIMVISCFDFESDFAARAYYMVEDYSYKDKDNNIVNTVLRGYGFVPDFYEFSFATEEEIKFFFDSVKAEGNMAKSQETKFHFYFESDFLPNNIRSKISKYIGN